MRLFLGGLSLLFTLFATLSLARGEELPQDPHSFLLAEWSGLHIQGLDPASQISVEYHFRKEKTGVVGEVARFRGGNLDDVGLLNDVVIEGGVARFSATYEGGKKVHYVLTLQFDEDRMQGWGYDATGKPFGVDIERKWVPSSK